jgi:hypothetical protein
LPDDFLTVAGFLDDDNGDVSARAAGISPFFLASAKRNLKTKGERNRTSKASEKCNKHQNKGGKDFGKHCNCMERNQNSGQRGYTPICPATQTRRINDP